MNAPACRRGDIWLVNFNPARGSEQRGIRPGLVIQNNIGNEHAATTIVAAITTTRKPYPVTVLLDTGEGGLGEPSMANLAQLLTVGRRRLMRRLGSLPPERMNQVDDAIRVSLGMA